MKDAKVAIFADVSRSAVSNYRAWKAGDKSRFKYLSTRDAQAIHAVMGLSQTEIVLLHFDLFGDTAHLTQAKAGQDYHIGRLSERVREINARFAKVGSPARILNIKDSRRGIGIQAVYEFCPQGVK